MDLFIEGLREAARQLLGGDPYLLEIIAFSLRVSGAAVLFGTLLGLPVGIALGVARFRGRRALVALVYTGFALPPVVVGLFVFMLLSRAGPLGTWGLLFTPTAIVMAQTLLAAPYIAGISLAAVQAVPADVRFQARALGAGRLRALWAQVREARLGLSAAVVAGFGAAISEVGAVMMVGGNIVGQTRVMTTAILLETRRGNFAAALGLGLVLLALAFLVNLLLMRLQEGRRETRWAAAERPWA